MWKGMCSIPLDQNRLNILSRRELLSRDSADSSRLSISGFMVRVHRRAFATQSVCNCPGPSMPLVSRALGCAPDGWFEVVITSACATVCPVSRSQMGKCWASGWSYVLCIECDSGSGRWRGCSVGCQRRSAAPRRGGGGCGQKNASSTHSRHRQTYARRVLRGDEG
jgi:hypothetical protein